MITHNRLILHRISLPTHKIKSSQLLNWRLTPLWETAAILEKRKLTRRTGTCSENISRCREGSAEFVGVSVIYLYGTNAPTLNSLRQHTFIVCFPGSGIWVQFDSESKSVIRLQSRCGGGSLLSSPGWTGDGLIQATYGRWPDSAAASGSIGQLTQGGLTPPDSRPQGE